MADETILVSISATIPRDLLFALVQHIRDFDVAYADCHFGVFAAGGSITADEMKAILERVQPPFPLLDTKKHN
jgi:hypothetical protein